MLQTKSRSRFMSRVISAIVLERTERKLREVPIWWMPRHSSILHTGKMREAEMRTVQVRCYKARCIGIDRPHHVYRVLDIRELQQEKWKSELFRYSACRNLGLLQTPAECKTARCRTKLCAFRKLMITWGYELDNLKRTWNSDLEMRRCTLACRDKSIYSDVTLALEG